MKLELKHLAPYLPYSLRYTFDNVAYWLDAGITITKNRFDFGTLLRLTAPEHTNNVIGIKWDDDKNVLSSFIELSSIHHKPILRPMSDLDKEIPGRPGYFYRDLGFFRKYCHSVEFDIDVENMEYDDVVKLLENHFDVFGLIDQGLAIDINTIEL